MTIGANAVGHNVQSVGQTERQKGCRTPEETLCHLEVKEKRKKKIIRLAIVTHNCALADTCG